MPAIWANIPCLFILHPLFRANLTPVRDSPQYHLFANRHREIFYKGAGKFLALMASVEPLLFNTILYLTFLAKHKRFIRQAAFAVDVFDGDVLGPWDLSLIYAHQSFLEFGIIVPSGIPDSTHAAVKPTRSQKFLFDFHYNSPLTSLRSS